MNSTIFNLARNALTPCSGLTINAAAEGLATASMDFHCHTSDVDGFPIQTRLIKGTPIINLFPLIGNGFSYLVVDTWTSRGESGGYTTITVNFRGVQITADGFANDNVTYTRNSSLREESIFNNPKFIADVDAFTRDTIRMGTLGTAYVQDSISPRYINLTATQRYRDYLETEDEEAWWDYIVVKRNLTYLVPSSEWTKSATGKSKLRNSDLAKLGKIETNVPGDPAAPGDDVWIMTGATENIQIEGEGVNSYSLTWTSGNWDELAYGE